MPLTINQQRHVLAALEVECPSCNGIGYHDHLDDKPELACSQCTVSWMNDDKGTGQVYLLDGIREPCDAIGYTDHEDDPPNCRLCHGLGWQPTESLEKWLESALRFGLYIVVWRYDSWRDKNHFTIMFMHHQRHDADTPEEAFYAALLEATTPLAINAVVAREWVEANIKGE